MDRNLYVQCYKPDMKESMGGKQLVRNFDYVSKFIYNLDFAIEKLEIFKNDKIRIKTYNG